MEHEPNARRMYSRCRNQIPHGRLRFLCRLIPGTAILRTWLSRKYSLSKNKALLVQERLNYLSYCILREILYTPISVPLYAHPPCPGIHGPAEPLSRDWVESYARHDIETTPLTSYI